MSDEIETTDTTQATTTEPASSMWDTLDRVAADVIEREPIRGEDGKFQPKVVAADAAPEGVSVPGSPTAAPAPDPAPPVIEAPQSLPAAVRAQWANLPPDVQTYWSNRESEVHRKITQDGERLKSLGALEEALSPYQDRLRQVNAPPAEYVRRLAEADRLLATDPVRGIQQVAQLYGINLAALNQSEQPDPNNALARQLAQVQSKLETFERETQAAKLSAAQERIDEFAKDKPHFAKVADSMATLIQSGLAKDMADAYAKAIKMDDEIAGQIEAEAKAEAERKAAEEAKRKAAEDAKLRPLAKKPGSAPTAPIKGKDIWATMDRVSSEVFARS